LLVLKVLKMHNDLDINMDHITKIEGHATLDLRVRDGKVEYAKFGITENKRFYTTAIKGKHYAQAPQFMSRICGTCSIAHLLCCIMAVEDALSIKVTRQTELLRLLSMYGMYIRDHALHLYIFTLPDLLGRDSILDLDENIPAERQWLEETFAVKGAGNRLSQVVAGRSVHAPYPVVGGHVKVPSEKDAADMVAELSKVRAFVLRLISAYMDCSFSYKVSTDFLALECPDLFLYGEEVVTSDGERFSKRDYYAHLEKVVIPYSQAVGYSLTGKVYMVGALARLNLNRERLHPQTKQDAQRFLSAFPSDNIFHNNLAQAIEILHAIDHSIQILSDNRFVQEKRAELPLKAGEGIAAVEAPRGILYYRVKIDDKGIITDATVIVPTQQNQIKMESDIKVVVQGMLDKDRDSIQFEIEKIIRAYDPCMSCASHFLKINWL